MVETAAIAIAKAQPFENRPLKSPVFKCFRISNGWGFQIPTVFKLNLDPVFLSFVQSETSVV